MDIKDVPVTDLRPHEKNPRTITDKAFDRLKLSLEREPDMMRARPCIALPDGRVIAGNMRLRAAEALGWPTVPCVTVDLDEKRAREWALRDNASYGDWHQDELAEYLYELRDMGGNLELTGFSEEETARILGEVAGPDVPDDDGGGYQEQFGVIVLCENEQHQRDVFGTLQDEGYDVKVVTT